MRDGLLASRRAMPYGICMTTLHGKHLIGNTTSAQGTLTFRAISGAGGQLMEPAFHEATESEIDRALKLADESFDALRTRSAEDRAALLDSIAEEIMALGDGLLERAHAETSLPMGRLTAERGRTAGQAKLFAAMIREGSWIDAVIDRPLPDRQPLARPDLRRMLVPIGPIVVFGASNFPLAISVAGTDTVSALGAGCPVVVKAHPAHPGTCELMAGAIQKALKKHNFPAGCFSLIQGASHEVGINLVKHPLTRAVAFTGSLRGGKALWEIANARPEPIPVYAELGSANPVFILPQALEQRSEQIAQGYVQSTNLGVGQFCTNPGLLLGLKGEPFTKFTTAVAAAAQATAPQTMLHAGIRDAYVQGTDAIAKTPGVTLVAKSAQAADPHLTQAACVMFKTDVKTFEAQPVLHREVFGPTSLIVEADTAVELETIAHHLEGHLTATIHATDDDLKNHASLVRILERKVGRIVINGFPTGVEVAHAMHHGGPYPASLDGHWTSIGSASIYRFVRPVCYQGFPDASLPAELQNGNPRKIWRKLDGEMSKDAV